MSRINSDASLSETEALEEAERLCKGMNIPGWEIYLEVEKSLSIEAKDQKVDRLTRARHSGMALRIFSRNKTGFGYATDLRTSSLREMVERAYQSALEVSPDRIREMTPPATNGVPELDIIDPRIKEVPESQKISRALELERSARSFDPRIRRVRNAEYQETCEDVFLRNSLGLHLHGERTVFIISLISVAEQGAEAQSGFEFDFSYKYDKLNVEETGTRASARAVSMLGARPASSGRYPVVFSPDTGARLMGVLAAAFSVEAVDKGRSWLKDKLGDKMFAYPVNIRDSGIFTRGGEAFPFDGEGTPCQDTALVEDGRITGFLFDRYYGKKLGHASTGNSLRDSIEDPPSVGPTNFYLEPGKGDTASLVGQVSQGLLVEDLLGVHTADPVTGEFSMGCSGKWIENGRVSYPVTGTALAGKLEDLLQRVEQVACDVRFMGPFGSPGILVGDMELSGE
jgi:PmbA protein